MAAAPAYDLSYLEPVGSRGASLPLAGAPSLRFHRNAEAHAGTSAFVVVARVAAVVLLVVAIAAMGRLALTSATVATAIENQQISNQIDSARTEGSTLEIAQSRLSTPDRIKETATQMGMAAPAAVMMIDLSGDVVVTDAAGNLSLSGSVAALAQSA